MKAIPATFLLLPVTLYLLAAVGKAQTGVESYQVYVGRRTGAICRDGSRSYATGRGACSWHGGVARWLYSETRYREIRDTPLARNEKKLWRTGHFSLLGVALIGVTIYIRRCRSGSTDATTGGPDNGMRGTG
ncbi:DUF3761 domain-containing protein [bacterium]|nr:DUF3761 domain-containing protein [bacterium]